MKRKLVLLCAMLFMTVTLLSQKTMIGINAGILFSMTKISQGTRTFVSQNRTGFNAGIVANIPVAEWFSFQAGLSFLQKGSNRTEMGVDVSTEWVSLNYLELPLNFLYHTKGRYGSFEIGAGPSFSYGLSAKGKFFINTFTSVEKLHFGSNADDYLKRFEFGANMLAGFQFTNGLFINAVYNIGLSNVAGYSEDKWKNYYGGLRIGYFFKDKKK